MGSTYILQEDDGRYSVTVKADLVRMKDWEKGQGIDQKLVGNKVKILEGEDYTLQYANQRYYISLPIAEELGWEKGDDLEWRVDGNGNLELQKAD